MGGAQVAKTEGAAMNQLLYRMDYAPTSMLYVLPTIDVAKKFSKQRLTPSIVEIPSVKLKVIDEVSKFRDADGNTQLIKTFKGGTLILAGANSAPSLRQMPIEVLIMDEIDGYVQDLQEEGDPVEIAKRRTANYPRRKILYISTPTIAETSRIEPLFESGDQRYFNVPCPECGAFFVIHWDNIKFEGKDPETAPATVYLECPHCKGRIEERHKTQMFEHGFWKPNFPDRSVRSYHISSLYSPLGFYSWQDAVKLFLKAKATFNKELLKVFVNTVLGETWTEAGKTIEASWVMGRRKKYSHEIPVGALVLTCGVDVQEDRIECEVVGWGRGEESWSIDYTVFMGDTEGESIWRLLYAHLHRTWAYSDGTQVPLAVTCIDSGHRAEVVYKFCAALTHKRVFPVKGYEGWGLGYTRKPKAVNDYGVYLFLAYVDEIKSKIYSQLRVEEPGPGYCHFPDKPIYDTHYFRMLTAESLRPRKLDGKNKLMWYLPKGRRNEALDCRCYSIAALSILNVDFDSLAKMTQGKPLVFSEKRMSGGNGGARVLSKGI